MLNAWRWRGMQRLRKTIARTWGPYTAYPHLAHPSVCAVIEERSRRTKDAQF